VTKKAGDYYSVGGSTVFVPLFEDAGDVVALTFHPDFRDANATTYVAPAIYYVKKNTGTTLASGIFTHPYYTLGGWQDEADPTDALGMQHALAAPIEIGEEDMDFYGFWTVNTDPAPVTVAPQSLEKVYDGTPLVPAADGFDVAGLPEGYTLHAELEAVLADAEAVGLTDVGSAPVRVASYAITRDSDGGDATERFPNVDASAEGALVVTPRGIEIEAASATKAYDGAALTDAGYRLSGGTLADGQRIGSVAVSGSITDVGTAGNVAADAVILDGSDMDVTANYAIEYVDGLLEVTAAEAKVEELVVNDEDNNNNDDEPAVDEEDGEDDGTVVAASTGGGSTTVDQADANPVPAAAAVPAPIQAVADALNGAVGAIADAIVPQAAWEPESVMPELIADEAAPRAASEQTWPLLNLLFMAAAVAVAVMAFVRRRREEGAEAEAAARRGNGTRRQRILTIIAAAVAALGALVWVFTEDFLGSMALADEYTLLQAVVTAAAVLTAALAMRRKDAEDAQQGDQPALA
jgi:hypothetical protein